MVTISSPIDQKAIAAAVEAAERQTSAKIVTVVAKASQHYHHHLLSWGFAIGTLLISALRYTNHVMDFSTLIIVQWSIAIFIMLLGHCFPALFRFVVPKHILHAHSAHKAAAELLAATHQVSATTPVLLIHLSLAEHYIHILPNSAVRAKITSAQWDQIIQNITPILVGGNISAACIKAVQEAALLLSQHFPNQ